jgi:transcriptional regulator with XRE-family HTH domain
MAGRKSISPEKRKGKPKYSDIVFAQKVQSRRLEMGITQSELAKRVDVPQARISEIEAGFFPSSRARIIALCRALETDPNHLFGFDEKGE